MGEQLSIFEPTGPEVIALREKYCKEAAKALGLAQVWSDLGCTAVANKLRAVAAQYHQWADEMAMLAEFEALGGVA